jgi:hypothetical protein
LSPQEVDYILSPEEFDSHYVHKSRRIHQRTVVHTATVQALAARWIEAGEDEAALAQVESAIEEAKIHPDTLNKRIRLNDRLWAVNNTAQISALAAEEDANLRRSARQAQLKEKSLQARTDAAEKQVSENEAASIRKASEKQRKWSQRVIKERKNDPVERAAKKDELYHSNLSEYDYLVSQHYVDPVSGGLFEITTVFYDKKEKVFRSVAVLQAD